MLMMDGKFKVNEKMSENDQLILQQLIENLAQTQQGNNMESSDEQPENRSETPSSNNDTELNELDNQEEEHTPAELNENVAAEMSRQLQFVGHQLVKLLDGLGKTPCMCHGCSKQLKKTLPIIQGSKNGNNSEFAKHLNNGSNNANVEFNEDGTIKRQCGRKSKYCSAEVKKEVADYAELHGATAAARKFDIPASVAAYYHRKLKKGYTGPGASIRSVPRSYAPYSTPGAVQDSRQHSIDTNGEESENHRSFNQSGEDFGRSPGGNFLRGRGRGRPKLIGDELDAELVEYMVEVKSKLPRAHLTASHALEVARAYILDKAPHILEENGGHINLKITWAMKLVSRTNERWRELHGGPPSPSPFDANNPALLQINNQLNEFINQLSQSNQNGATSEITNIRELQFPFNVGNNEEMDGDMEEDEKNYVGSTGNNGQQLIAE
ncbi:BMA-ATTF-4, isoform b [Aphelenchoides bicaudatus]|nr:BMA-ATTF-4, isoform b [Aphelenchoides bicaudatus]